MDPSKQVRYLKKRCRLCLTRNGIRVAFQARRGLFGRQNVVQCSGRITGGGCRNLRVHTTSSTSTSINEREAAGALPEEVGEPLLVVIAVSVGQFAVAHAAIGIKCEGLDISSGRGRIRRIRRIRRVGSESASCAHYQSTQ